MRRKLLALACLLAIILGVFAVGATATTQEGTYNVGYAKVDVSPWLKDYPDAQNMTDDNGNAIGFTYDASWANDYPDYFTKMSLVVDTEGSKDPVDVGYFCAPIGYMGRVFNTVVDTNGDNLHGKGDGIYATVTSVTDGEDETLIFVTIEGIGGYTVLLDALKTSAVEAIAAAGGNLSADRIYVNGSHSHCSIDLSRLAARKDAPSVAYWEYYKQQVVNAVVEAYNTSTPATMSKGQLDVSGTIGHQMNFIRHYNNEIVTKEIFGYPLATEWSIKGSNFGGSEGKRKSHLYEADDTLYLLQFTPTNGEDPIVLMNWRAHGTMVGSSSALSGDHIAGIRSAMENAGYRFAFLQGAAGNTVPSSAIENLNTWKTGAASDFTYTSTNTDENNVNRYGYWMTKAALACLNNNMVQTDEGKIRTLSYDFVTNKQKETAIEIEAVFYWKDVMGRPDEKGDTYTVDGKEYTFGGWPWIYTSSTGETAIFDSYYHVSNAYERNSSPAAQAATQNAPIRLDAMLLGDDVAFVTCGCEISDRYSLTDALVFNKDSGYKLRDNDNDWLDLIDDTYGMPFVLGYTNDQHPYMSNSLSYTYNAGSTKVAGGCYESKTSKFAQGTGEEMIVKFNNMLDSLGAFSASKTADCSACGSSAEWFGINEYTYSKLQNNPNGHYYLTGDISTKSGISLAANTTLCLDLNGHSLTGNSKVFSIPATATLNLLDGVGTGKVNAVANGSAHVGGIAQFYGTCNIYGGTYSLLASDAESPTAGGLFAVQSKASLNVYGGTLYGTDLSAETHGYTAKDGSGGAIYLYAGGNLFVGGDARIVSGTVPAHGFGPCVVAHSSACNVTLQDKAKVDDIYFLGIGGSSLTVSNAYTGTANITLDTGITLTEGMDIGTSDKADLSGATITCTNDPEYKLYASGSNLVLQRDPVAYIGETPYYTLQSAVKAAESGATIRLAMDIAETVSVTKNVTIDLNGCDISNITADGCTLTCFDSQTDDYNVADGVYGKLTGNAVAAEGYMAVTGDEGTSFHKVDLSITAMSLRASVAGVYYKSNFQADEVAAKRIAKYGVALNVKAEPNKTNMETTSAYSYFTKFVSGEATGTLLKNIMKPANSDANNNRNANMAVYGRPYILTTDGEYIFGTTVQRSLKQQLEAIDANWNSYTEAAQKTVLRLYKDFEGTMSSWNIPNIKNIADPGSDGILKVLIVGNSHGLDSTNLLCEVLKDQGMKSEEFVVGALYTGGCRMDQHADFMTNNGTYDTYNENGGPDDTNGIAWEVVDKPTPNVPFDRHQWDIVIMQQMNHRAGVEDQYVKSQFETVLNYISDHQIGNPKLGWQMIWANPDDYATYLDDDAPLNNPSPASWRTQHEDWYGIGKAGTYLSRNMYNKVVDCTQKFITDSTDFLGKDYFDFVIPAATTIQYARDILGYEQDQLYRDYTHLSDFGRLMSAYTWYGKIMECLGGEPVTISNVGVDAIPAGLHTAMSTYPTTDSGYAITEQMQSDIKTAVNWALAHPYELPEANADNANDGVTKILGIGNSYTIDSLHLLGEIYKAEKPGTNLELGIAYYSGCSLQSHVGFYNANDAVYEYYYYDSEADTWTKTKNVTLKQIIQAQDWDMVSLQQNSSGSGVASGYDYIPTVKGIVEKELRYKPTYLWNMTWAVPEVDIPTDNYTLDNAPNANSFKTYYQSSQATMYKMIMQCVQNKVVPDTDFKYLVPVGTAIQNANATFTDCDLYRDYTHLNDYARLIAAYTWYCELEGVTLEDVQVTSVPATLTNSYKDGGNYTLTEQQITVLVNAVKSAMSTKFQTTDTSVYG